jgi:hypothetical protein
MKHLILVLPLVLAGCATQSTTWLKPGTEVTRAERTFLSCEAKARADFPVANRPVVTSSISVGGRFCDGPFCFGLARGVPNQSTADPNRDLRNRSVALCMQDAGFTQVTVPVCRPGQDLQAITVQPATPTGLCVSGGQIAAIR